MAEPIRWTLDELLALPPAKRRKVLAKLDGDQLAGALTVCADDLTRTEQRLERLKDLRLTMYEAGRVVSPRLTFMRMGQLTGVSEPAVIQTLNKAKDRRAAAG